MWCIIFVVELPKYILRTDTAIIWKEIKNIASSITEGLGLVYSCSYYFNVGRAVKFTFFIKDELLRVFGYINITFGCLR